MPRRLEFDLDQALERATRAFWEHGYTRTSLRSLLEVIAIGEGSFYNTFKSKEHLYRLCLERYNDTVSRRRLAALASGDSAADGVRAFFRTVLDELDDPTTPQVCLLAGSLSADVLEARELGAYVLDEMQVFEAAFRDRLAASKEAGDLQADFDVAAAAGLLLTYLQGLFRVIRTLHSRKQSEEEIDALLCGLGL